MTVKQLKNILEDALNDLESFNDTDTVRMVSNTYFLHGASRFLGISGYDGGYIDLSNPVEEDDEEGDD